MERTTETTDLMREKLFQYVMERDWGGVVSIYESELTAPDTQITKSGDTALHIAVKAGQVDVIKTLVDKMSKKGLHALKAKNEQGNTPLHLAASLGNVEMCRAIASKDPTLLAQRNVDNETPFFFAALHSKKDAFLCLHRIIPGADPNKDQGLSYGRRMDGATILHVTIAGEHFGLAFQIIHLYPLFVNYRHSNGATPLHLLASNPSAFKSSSLLSAFKTLIYDCISMDEVKKGDPMKEEEEASENNTNPRYPQNYETCMNFYRLVKMAIVRVTKIKGANQPKDLENQQVTKNKSVQNQSDDPKNHQGNGKLLLPPNYTTCFDILQFFGKAMLIILGLGSTEIRRLANKKMKHKWSLQVLDELLQYTNMYKYNEYMDDQYMGRNNQFRSLEETRPYDFADSGDVNFSTDIEQPDLVPKRNESAGCKWKRSSVVDMKETPMLIAAKNGITEMVERILNKFPVAIHDVNREEKNVVLLAVENRQPHVYQFLLPGKSNIMNESIFHKVDKDGNSALHLAARFGDSKPWNSPGAALQMQWEINWFKFVKESMPSQFFVRLNKNGETARDISTKTHQELVKNGGEWLTKTSESCSVVAALIATVAFATSATIPGGVKEDNGTPNFVNQPAFKAFAISSLIALCTSVTAVVLFLAILTSRYQERDFGESLPRRLLLGLSSLFVSIASMLVSFCAGHFFVLEDQLSYVVFPVYAVICLPVTLFAIAQFPLYFDVAVAYFTKVPQRSYAGLP